MIVDGVIDEFGGGVELVGNCVYCCYVYVGVVYVIGFYVYLDVLCCVGVLVFLV